MKYLFLTILLLPNLVIASTETRIYELTNQVRAEKGAACLVRSGKLDKVAKAKLLDMKAGGYFSQTSPKGLKYYHIMNSQGYKWIGAGENLAKGFKTPDETVTAWINSPLHYKNLVEPRFHEIGIASDGNLAVQIFGTTKTSKSIKCVN